MKRLIRIAAMLYPAEWRQRYGAEFLCLIDDTRPGWRDLFDVLKGGVAMRLTRASALAVILTFATIGVGIGGAVAWRWPDQYRAATLLVPLSNPSQTLDDARLSRIIRLYNLYPHHVRWFGPFPYASGAADMSERLSAFRQDIHVKTLTVPPGSVVEVSFQYSHPLNDPELKVIQEPTLVASVANQVGDLYLTGLPPQQMIVDQARIPPGPFRPNRPLLLAIGLFGGALLGLFIALLRGVSTRLVAQ